MKKFQNKLKSLDWKRILKKCTELFIVGLIFFLVAPQVIYITIKRSQKDNMYTEVQDVPERKTVIVFGAAIDNETTPSEVLKDRIQVAVNLYNEGKVEKVIMSGDNRFVNYDEPGAMISYAKELGIPEEVLQADYAGRRTYDTCYRAKHIFGLDKAILVTQDFHLPRALYICNSLGIESIGVSADLHEYSYASKMKLREVYALSLALWDVHIWKPDVVLGEKIEL